LLAISTTRVILSFGKKAAAAAAEEEEEEKAKKNPKLDRTSGNARRGSFGVVDELAAEWHKMSSHQPLKFPCLPPTLVPSEIVRNNGVCGILRTTYHIPRRRWLKTWLN
jgi:hypothetical protein